MTCLIGVWKCHLCVIACQIETCISQFTNGTLTRTQNSLMSQFPIIISPITSHLSLSCLQLTYHLRTQSLVIPCYHYKLWSWVNTEYRIALVYQTRSSAYIVYCIIRLPLPASLCSVICWVGPHWTQFPMIPRFQVDQWIQSQHLSCLAYNLQPVAQQPLDCPPPDWPPPSTYPM